MTNTRDTAIAHLAALGLTTKVAGRIVDRCGVDLRNLTIAELRAAGAPESKATRVYSALEAARQLATSRAADGMRLDTAESVHALLGPVIGHCDREHFVVIAIDARNRVLGHEVIAIGSAHMVDVSPREIFRAALRMGAIGIAVAHNHPSGDPTPSDEDVAITKRIREAGQLIGIPCIDHVVITSERFASIAEQYPNSI